MEKDLKQITTTNANRITALRLRYDFNRFMDNIYRNVEDLRDSNYIRECQEINARREIGYETYTSAFERDESI